MKSNYAESHFLRLQDYVAEGSRGELTAAESDYMDLLWAAVGMVRKYGREAALEWLTEERGCSRHVAARIYQETINLFYADDQVVQNAWRNLLFQKLMDAARIMEQQYFVVPDDPEEAQSRKKPTAKEFEAYAKLIGQAARIKRIDQPDERKPATQNNIRQINVITTDPAQLGIPATDKRAIMDNAYFRQLPARHQKRLAMEIGAAPMNIDDILNTSEELAAEVEP